MIGLDQVWGTILPIWLLKDLSYGPEIWWDDAQYHEADRNVKWSCSDNFCALDGTLKFLHDRLGPGPREDDSY